MTHEQETWTVLKVLNWTKEYLSQKGVENARLESEWMLCAVLGLDRMGLYVNFDKPLTEAELAAYRAMVMRRARREPLQYILGTQEFMGLEFDVTPDVLIPRHDTEVLVKAAVQRAGEHGRILDIGVGSGCIAVAIAKALPLADVYGVDKSPAALAVARGNADKHGARLNLSEGSLLEPFAGQRFDLIVSNPPYIPTSDLAGLQEEVRGYEPRHALDGGDDGLDFYRLIILAAPGHLANGGWLIFEVGIGEAGPVLELLKQGGDFTDLFAEHDLNGIDRVVGARLV